MNVLRAARRKLPFCFSLLVLLSAAIAWAEPWTSEDESLPEKDAAGEAAVPVDNMAASISEARGRARLLHETLHGALQVMHRDFFREDEGLKIPSRSLEDVFRELARSQGVQLRWIAVDLKAMNIDNEPQTEFEIEAVRRLKSGKSEFDQVSEGKFQFAGRIRLSATCLSCHASRRSSNDDRAAGLVISIPLKTAR